MKKIFATILLLASFALYTPASAQTFTPGNFFKQLGNTIYLANLLHVLSVNGYLNFDQTSGETGYGIRSNSGVMEFKDDGGLWQAFGTGSGGGAAWEEIFTNAIAPTSTTNGIYVTASSTLAGLQSNGVTSYIYGSGGLRVVDGNLNLDDPASIISFNEVEGGIYFQDGRFYEYSGDLSYNFEADTGPIVYNAFSAKRYAMGTYDPMLNFGSGSGDFALTYGGLHVTDDGADNGAIVVEGDNTSGFWLADRGASANQKIYSMVTDGGQFLLQQRNDNLSVKDTALQIGTDGDVVVPNNISVSGTSNFNGTLTAGNADFGGTVTVTETIETGSLSASENSTTTNSTYLGTTAGLNGEYINNWSDIVSGYNGAWEWNGFALTPTSSSAGIFVNASSTINGDLRSNGDLYAGNIFAPAGDTSIVIGFEGGDSPFDLSAGINEALIDFTGGMFVNEQGGYGGYLETDDYVAVGGYLTVAGNATTTGHLEADGSFYIKDLNAGLGEDNPRSITVPSGFNSDNDFNRFLVVRGDTTGGDEGLFLRRSDDAVGLDLWAESGGSGDSYIDSRFTGASGGMNFRVGTNSTPVDAMRIENVTGNIGVGTTTPDFLLSIAGGTEKQLGITDSAGNRFFEIGGEISAPSGGLKIGDIEGVEGDQLFGIEFDTYRAYFSQFKLGVATTTPGGTFAEEFTVSGNSYFESSVLSSRATIDVNTRNIDGTGYGVRSLIDSSSPDTNIAYAGYFNTSATNINNDNYGIYTAASNSVNDNWALYSAAGENYFAGNVGIGVEPSFLLDLDPGTNDQQIIHLETNAANQGEYGEIVGTNDSNGEAAIRFTNNSINGSDFELAFLTDTAGGSPTEKMRIDHEGDVGIGEASPASILDIAYSGTNNYAVQLDYNPTSSGFGYYVDLDYTANSFGPTHIGFYGDIDSNVQATNVYGAQLDVSGTGSSGADAYGGVFNVSSAGSVGIGVVGGYDTDTTIAGAGVYGYSSTSVTTNPTISGDWAGYFAGDTYVSGDLGIGQSSPAYAIDVLDATPTLRLQASSGNPTVWLRSSGGIDWEIENDGTNLDIVREGTVELTVSSSVLAPGGANQLSLGSSTLEWEDIYATLPSTASCYPFVMVDSNNRFWQLDTSGENYSYTNFNSDFVTYACGVLESVIPT